MSQLPNFPDDLGEGIVVIDGHRNAFLGIVTMFEDAQPRACYDRERIIQNLIADEMTLEEAIEFFDFNIAGAYAGQQTPVFISRCLPPEEHP